MPPKKPKTVRQPGAAAADTEVEPVGATEPGESDIDEAIDLAKSGKARKIAKPKPVVPPSKVKGDPLRKPEAAVNASKQMTYEAAMKLRGEGKLQRAVLTERGWVPPNDRKAPAGPQPVEG